MSVVHHLNCGTMCPLAAPLLGQGGALRDRGRLVCHCLLLETARGLVLVETGFGARDVATPAQLEAGFRAVAGPRLDRRETAIEQVRARGFQPEDVRHVVVTHLDVDHAGGIADFPWATIHVHAREQQAAVARRRRVDRRRYVPAHFAHGPRWQTYDEAGDQLFGLQAVRPLVGLDETIALVPLFGHSRGHSGVAANVGGRWLLHAGDAFFHPDELLAPPRCPPGLRLFQALVQHDRRARLANQARLRALHAARSDEVAVFCAHDPTALERLAKVA
ncbi:MAG: MBL fold metallo-hydrolase [Myxococcales bacterium]|nr:MBL fold metallo-hydrolase [Myxococcales bacterium]